MMILDRPSTSRLALAEARDVPLKLYPSIIRKREEERLRELAPILSAMAVSEKGAYDPLGRFSYPVKRPHDDQPKDEATCNNGAMAVDLECRGKMLDWCTRASFVSSNAS